MSRQEVALKAAENLEAVAEMIETKGMWCKGEWTGLQALSDEPGPDGRYVFHRVGCAEGLLMEQLGLYDNTLDLQPNMELYFSGMEDHYQQRLRKTPEWHYLFNAIVEQEYPWLEGSLSLRNATVTGWNDWDDVTADEVVRVFRVAVHNAKLEAGS